MRKRLAAHADGEDGRGALASAIPHTDCCAPTSVAVRMCFSLQTRRHLLRSEYVTGLVDDDGADADADSDSDSDSDPVAHADT